MRNRKDLTRDQAEAEQNKIWQALVDEYTGVKQKFPERLAAIQVELDKWEERKLGLMKRYAEADDRIAQYQGKIAEAARVRIAQKHAVLTGRRTSESKLVKAQRLARELASLTADLRREGIDLD